MFSRPRRTSSSESNSKSAPKYYRNEGVRIGNRIREGMISESFRIFRRGHLRKTARETADLFSLPFYCAVMIRLPDECLWDTTLRTTLQRSENHSCKTSAFETPGVEGQKLTRSFVRSFVRSPPRSGSSNYPSNLRSSICIRSRRRAHSAELIRKF